MTLRLAVEQQAPMAKPWVANKLGPWGAMTSWLVTARRRKGMDRRVLQAATKLVEEAQQQLATQPVKAQQQLATQPVKAATLRSASQHVQVQVASAPWGSSQLLRVAERQAAMKRQVSIERQVPAALTLPGPRLISDELLRVVAQHHGAMRPWSMRERPQPATR